MSEAKTYVADSPCKRGHEPIRYVKGRKCVECQRLYNKKHNKATNAKFGGEYRKAANAKTNGKRKQDAALIKAHVAKEAAIIRAAETPLPPTPRELQRAAHLEAINYPPERYWGQED